MTVNMNMHGTMPDPSSDPMPNPLRVTLVVPCYNEATRLDRAAFEQALTTTGWLDFVFVDDGSGDGTGALLAALQAAHPRRVQVVALPRNRGKAEAVRQGLLLAAATSPLVGFWDADLAAPLAECEGLREQLVAGGADWIFGIRLRSLGRRIERRSLRHYLGRVFATVASVLLRVDSYDTQCGAKLFRVTPLLHAVLSEPFRSRWIFDVEMLVRADALLRGTDQAPEANPLTRLVHEQPLTVWIHRAGSRVRPTDFVKAMLELVSVRRDRGRWMARALARPVSGSMAPLH